MEVVESANVERRERESKVEAEKRRESGTPFFGYSIVPKYCSKWDERKQLERTRELRENDDVTCNIIGE